MLVTKNTIFNVYFRDISGFKLVLVGEDEEGVNNVKELGFVYDTHDAYNIAKALEVVNGGIYSVLMISKTGFIEKFGNRIARVANLFN